MFIELVELLRCTREHDESWLVASIEKMTDRSIETGMLGCPVCGDQYPVVNGVVDFTTGAASRSRGPSTFDSDELALRAGAFLGLEGGGGVVVLGGEWARAAAALADTADVRVIAVNADEDVRESSTVGLIRASNVIPLAAGSCAGVALDASFSSAALASAQRVTRAGGRVVGAAGSAPPAALTVLAEDATCWVAEKPPEITTLRRGNR